MFHATVNFLSRTPSLDGQFPKDVGNSSVHAGLTMAWDCKSHPNGQDLWRLLQRGANDPADLSNRLILFRNG